MFGTKAKPPTVKAFDDNKMTVEFEFNDDWTFKRGDNLRVILGVKEANELLAQLMAELARIQK